MSTSRTCRALTVAAAALLVASGCSSSDSDSEPSGAPESAMALGTAKELSFDAATVDLSVDDIREATDADIAQHGLTPGPDEDLWFVTYSMTLTDGTAGDLDADSVYPAAEDWTGITDRGGEVKQTKVLGAGFDCTADGSATNGIANDAPFVDCKVFKTGPDASLEAVTIGDHGTWSTQP